MSQIANKGTSAIRKYVPGKSVKEAQAELGIVEMIKLASNENAFGASPHSVRSIRQMADQIHVYPDSQSREIRLRLAEHNGAHLDTYRFETLAFFFGMAERSRIWMAA